MQVHSLNFDDFCEDNYTLLGIHTTLEDYKLAYLLNKELKTTFSRAAYDLDFEGKNSNASFPVYKFTDSKYDFDWFLISNIFSNNTNISSENVLFTSETKNYLIPEKKKVDFFLKITGDTNYADVQDALTKIKTIPEVITSYKIDLTTLKSKDSLIF